jgi:hypothetical protein
MKTKLRLTILLAMFCLSIKAQTSPPSVTTIYGLSESKAIASLSDTLTFTPFITGTIITTQYLNKGVVFSGFSGSTDPLVADYISSYGRILHSDNWFNPLRMNFVDTLNANQYHLAKRIEFDNVVDSVISSGEVDYMSIDVYDSMNVLIYHYLSISPEHVVLNFASPVVAYITIDDSSNTAYALDNILVDFGIPTSVHEIFLNDFRIFPNPTNSTLTIKTDVAWQDATATLTNLEGRVVFSQALTNNQQQSLDIGHLPNGMYFVTVQSAQQKWVRRVVKAE